MRNFCTGDLGKTAVAYVLPSLPHTGANCRVQNMGNGKGLIRGRILAMVEEFAFSDGVGVGEFDIVGLGDNKSISFYGNNPQYSYVKCDTRTHQDYLCSCHLINNPKYW